MKKENKDCNFMIPVGKTMLEQMRNIREQDDFNWCAYIRKCIEEKLRERKIEQVK